MKPLVPRLRPSIASRMASRIQALSQTFPQSASRKAPAPGKRAISGTGKRFSQLADDPNFASIVDQPAQLVRVSRKHGPGLILLALMPITAFCLGTWQVQRLGWKTDLLAKLEDRIIRPPLPLPPDIDPDMVSDFDYRRVYAIGKFRHDKEMLIGPRVYDGNNGYQVVTPLERDRVVDIDGNVVSKKSSTVLVNRGWIPKKFMSQRTRPQSLEEGEVMVEGLLRQPWKRNMFTPDNKPETGEFFFPDVKQMAELTGSQPIWIEQTTEPDMLKFMEYKEKGIPIPRPAKIDVRNNHAQYIFTWYGLCIATSIMLWMVVKKKPSDISRRVRTSRQW